MVETDGAQTDRLGAGPGTASEGGVIGLTRPWRWPLRPVDLLLLLVVAVVYAATLQRGPGLADAGKFAFQPHVFGTPHATGYPLYSVVAGIWSHLVPVGAIATRANAFSAASALAAGVVLLLVLHELRVSAWGRTFGLVVFVLAPVVWLQATMAEVYTFSVLWIALVVLFALRAMRTAAMVDLALAFGVYGLSFANHLTAVTMVPALGLVLVVVVRRHEHVGRTLAVAGGALLAGGALALLTYLYLPSRTAADAPYLEVIVRDAGDLVGVLTGRDFRGQMFAFGPGELVVDRVPLLGRLLWTNLLLAAALVPVGIWRCWDRTGAFLVLTATGSLLWMANYDIADIEVYLVPSLFVLSVLAAAGVDRLVGLRPTSAWWAPAVGVAALLLTLPGLVRGGREVRDDRDRVADAVAMMGIDGVEGPAIVVTNSDTGAGYAAFEFTAYRLLGEGGGGERDIWLVNKASPEAVRAYLDGDGDLDASRRRWSSEGVDDDPPPPGLPVFVVDAPTARTFEASGLAVTPDGSGRDLWSVAR